MSETPRTRTPGPVLISFVIAFAVTLTYALLERERSFPYDSGNYWRLADTFTKDGSFSLLNFASPVRGYALPLFDRGLIEFGAALGLSDSLLVKLLNAAVFAAVATMLIPLLASVAFPSRRWGVWQRLAFAALLIPFWGGYVQYPLSDFPALAAAVIAVVAVSRAPSLRWLALAGVATALALNVRPAYLLLCPIVAALFAWAWVSERRERTAGGTRQWVIGGAVLAIGFALISLPQSLAMHRHHGTYSFVPGAAEKLSAVQLTKGMLVQRYETFVGKGEPGPGMNYIDKAGSRLVAQDDDGVISSSSEYLELTLAHPTTVAGTWVRHLVNGLDQRYSTPYVERFAGPSRNPVRIFGFVLVFLGLLRVAWPAARRSLGPGTRWRYVAVLPLCCLTSLASGMETRFLLPLYVTCWMLVLAGPWPNPVRAEGTFARRARTPVVIAIAFVAFMTVTVAIASQATGTLIFV